MMVLDKDVEKKIRGKAALLLRQGFAPRDGIIFDVKSMAAPEGSRGRPYPAEVLAAVGRIVDSEIKKQCRAQESWPSVTDNDRLDTALLALDARGIIARQRWFSVPRIRVEMLAAAAAGRDVRGYTFTQYEGADSAADGAGVWLHHGSADRTAQAGRAVANEIVAALKAHGLGPDWSKKLSNSIHVPMKWQPRFPTTGEVLGSQLVCYRHNGPYCLECETIANSLRHRAAA